MADSEARSNPEVPAGAEEQFPATSAGEPPTHPEPPPVCPRCGWSNTRPSYTRTAFDTVLGAISLRAFRCRSCGNRFHAFRRR